MSQRIGAATRSAATPAAEELKKLGVQLLELDVTKDSEESLVQKLQGVDVIVSVVTATTDALESQKPLFKAAKTAGVKRVVPSDFGTPAPNGVMLLNDMVRKIFVKHTTHTDGSRAQKASIHRYIQELGIGYTWIDIGWWKQLMLPYPSSFDAGWASTLSYRFFADGKQPFAVTDRRVIGDFVGRIIKDDRTMNQYVFCYEEVVTQEQLWKIAEEVCSEGASILEKKVQVSISRLVDTVFSGLMKGFAGVTRGDSGPTERRTCRRERRSHQPPEARLAIHPGVQPQHVYPRR